MTDLEKRISIAEACGWKIHRTSMKGPKEGVVLIHIFRPDKKPAHRYPSREDSGVMGYIPDYLTDLNAMHDAEKFLLKHRLTINNCCTDAWACYERELRHSYSPRHSPSSHHSINAIHATAAQRAEAFLRTLGKWKEEPQPAVA